MLGTHKIDSRRFNYKDSESYGNLIVNDHVDIILSNLESISKNRILFHNLTDSLCEKYFISGIDGIELKKADAITSLRSIYRNVPISHLTEKLHLLELMIQLGYMFGTDEYHYEYLNLLDYENIIDDPRKINKMSLWDSYYYFINKKIRDEELENNLISKDYGNYNSQIALLLANATKSNYNEVIEKYNIVIDSKMRKYYDKMKYNTKKNIIIVSR